MGTNLRFIVSDGFLQLFLHDPGVGADGDGREVDVVDREVGAVHAIHSHGHVLRGFSRTAILT